MRISNSQRRALDAIKNMIEVQTSDLFAHNVMVIIRGILDIEEDEITPLKSNDELDLTLKELNEKMGGVLPIGPCQPNKLGEYPWGNPPTIDVWYKSDTGNPPKYLTEEEKLTPLAQTSEYIAVIGATDGPIVTTTNATLESTENCRGTDFRDGQTSFNDK